MIEKVVRNYLNSVLDVPVLMEKPREEIKRYVLVEKSGSGMENWVENATFIIQCYAESLFEAAALNEALKNAMVGPDGIITLNDISKCELNSDYNYTDTNSKEYRYQAIYEIYY